MSSPPSSSFKMFPGYEQFPVISKLLPMIGGIADVLKPYGATYAVVGGAAANLYLERILDIRDIDVKVCLPNMDDHDDVVLDLIDFLANMIARPGTAESVGSYPNIPGTILDPVAKLENVSSPLLRSGPFNILVLPHDVKDTQTRIVLRGRWPIGKFTMRSKSRVRKYYRYMEYLDITIPHKVCHHSLPVETIRNIPVLALHDLVREQIVLLESPEFQKRGRRYEERASKKRRLMDLVSLLKEPLSNNNNRRKKEVLRGTNV